MKSEIKAIYKCAQKDLYSVADTAWKNYLNHLQAFSDLKAMYDANYGNDSLSKIDGARALPDKDTRNTPSQVMHIELVGLGNVCLKNFKRLKSYITTAYANPDEQMVRMNEAGQSYFAEAGNEDWESMEALNINSEQFISTHLNELTANNNMPASFQGVHSNACSDFKNKYDDFKEFEQTSEVTALKIKANNEVYTRMIEMLKDGQLIFEDVPETYQMFVFSNLLAMINPPVAGVQGSVLDSVSFDPIPEVHLTAQMDGQPIKGIDVNLDGSFSKQLEEGKYVLVCMAAGYDTQTLEVDLKLTGLKRINIELVKTV